LIGKAYLGRVREEELEKEAEVERGGREEKRRRSERVRGVGTW
jgi:hypothetical protein